MALLVSNAQLKILTTDLYVKRDCLLYNPRRRT